MLFTVIDDLFDGYTILYNQQNGETSVWCDRCDEWVYESGNTDSIDERGLYDEIIDAHSPTTVTFKSPDTI